MAFNRSTMIELLEGVRTFEQDVYPEKEQLFRNLAYHQNPATLFITCADSRISPPMITQTEPGELFLIRNVGNIVPAYGINIGSTSSAIEYAVAVLKVKNIIICGHSNCGAMSALMDLDSPKMRKLSTIRRWLCNAEAARASLVDIDPEHPTPEMIRALTEANVRLQLAHLRTHPSVAAALARRELAIEGWYYDIPNGRLRVLDLLEDSTISVDEAIRELREQQSDSANAPAISGHICHPHDHHGHR
ncbi:carbonic anhydrase [Formicincola oecophyllae]|uniref:Carbonic anhydrase n=1 Tax=Formicincola oecophyllae TaxID=2558361 RepID=A0A4Y6UBM3_9PROT|nr:carbonic anhydrase [Formicincola oecophyllae]QDH13867.1 carbonic anhydrase [Formicincola oecophyllae]